MDKNVTAVQWLENEMKNRYAIASTHECIELFKQALAMEREQSIHDYCEGFKASDDGWNGTYGIIDMDNIVEEINAEQYFTDTYHTEP